MVTVVGCTAPAIVSIRRLKFFNFFMCGRWVLVSATAVMQLGLVLPPAKPATALCSGHAQLVQKGG